MLHIYIDESGSFVSATDEGSWNLTSALVIPSPDKRKCIKALRNLKVENGFKYNEEIKLKHVSEDSYLKFLAGLATTNCTVYPVATDAGSQLVRDIEYQRDTQANKIEEHKNKMHYPEVAQMLEDIANKVRALAPQLYLQFVCQIALVSDVVRKSILFYVQRTPKQLNSFRWRIDEKTGGVSSFEKSFRLLVPPLLQSESIKEPDIHVSDFDYSAMQDFFYTKDTKPTYLEEHYDIKTSSEGGLNIGKLVWDDFEFVDSKTEEGVQISDLIVSGLRRTLRGDFNNDQEISEALGSLMVETIDNGFPIRFITTSEAEACLSNNVITVSKVFKINQKPMLE